MNTPLTSLVYHISRALRPLAVRRPRLVPPSGTTRDGQWYVSTHTGQEPCFALFAPLLLPGWYMLELKVLSSTTAGNALLSMEYTQGRSTEQIQAFLPYTNIKGTKRIVCIGRKCKKLFLYPVEGKNDPHLRFAIPELCFVPLLPFHAKALMIRRLKAKHPAYQGLSHETILRSLGSVQKLKDQYDQTFVRHLDHGRYSYQEWIDHHEATIAEEHIKPALSGSPGAWPDPQTPAISILIPVQAGTDAGSLDQTITSLASQNTPAAEVSLISDPPDPGVDLNHLAPNHNRLRVRLLEKAKAWNAVSGQYVLLLFPGDVLAQNAFSHISRLLAANPNAAMIYSDHDYLDAKGQRYDPCFKPDWNPELLLAHNYISRMCLVRKDLVDQALQAGVELSFEQEYGFLLACAAGAKGEEILHIPLILCHQGAWTGAQPESSAKNHTSWNEQQALGYFLRQTGRQAEIEPGPIPGSNRILYAQPHPLPLVSLIIPTRDHPDLLQTCISSIQEKTEYWPYEIILLDNQSRDPKALRLLRELDRHPGIRVLSWDRPFNYSEINNFGVTQAKGAVLAFLNNDLEVISPEWLTEMITHVCRSEVGCVGAKLLYPDHTIQHSGVILGIGGVAGHAHRFFEADHPGYAQRLCLTQNMSVVTGACLLIRRKVFAEVGGFDPRLAGAYNDVDLCLKVGQAGYRNLWTPYALFYHHESKSRGGVDTPAKRKQFEKEQDLMKGKWTHLLYCDPCYNPNLTLEFEDFSLKSSTSFGVV